MVYDPTNWQNREVEKPRTFTMTDNADGTITLTPAEGTILNAGTPIVAANMNKIEEQLVVADSHMNNTSNPHGVTTGQIGALSDYERYNILMYTETNQNYVGNQFSTMYFPLAENAWGGITNLDGKTVEVPRDGFALINVALSFTDITLTSAPYIVVNIAAGGRQHRIGGAHYSSNGNFSVNGSIVVYLKALDTIAVSVAAAEDYTVIGVAGEVRSYCAVRELV